MPIIDIFSKRQRRLKGDVPDVYVYDELPRTLRVQAIAIIRDLLGEPQYRSVMDPVWSAYKFINESLRREYGEIQLHTGTPTMTIRLSSSDFF